MISYLKAFFPLMRFHATAIIFILLAGVFLPLAPNSKAETKVTQRSAKKVPAWLSQAHTDAVVITVDAPTLAEAQRRALAELQQRLIQAVAVNVTVDQTNRASETITTGGNVESEDEYTRLAQTNSARLPFLKDVSLANATDLYWELRQDKKTKKEQYSYSILYPFSKSQRRKLVNQFETLDAEKTATLNQLANDIDEITSVEQIADALATLEGLKQYFFDATRLQETSTLVRRYRNLYNQLTLVGAPEGEGRYAVQLLLAGKPVRCAVPPKVSSECASAIKVLPRDGNYLITYSTEDCLPEEPNTIEVVWKVASKKLSHTISL